MPEVSAFYHEPSGTWSYVVADPATGHAAVIDPTGDGVADRIVAHVERAGLTVDWTLETHAHADHVSAAPALRERLGGRTAIGEGIRRVQKTFGAHPADGSQFDRLLADGDTLRIGDLAVRVIATPGHTPDGVSYLIGDAVFIGDTLFMPDSGSARCDFPGGDAIQLYESIQRLYTLPHATRVFVCHDYAPGGREPRYETTVAEQRAANIHVRDGVSADEFRALRTARDATLAPPAMLEVAIPANIRGGQLEAGA